MEAKDLMIGDWVSIEHYKYEYLNCIGQIAGINECEGSIEPKTFNVRYEKDGKRGLNVGISKRNVFPILITKEILEKNGFSKVGDDIWQLDVKSHWFWIDFNQYIFGCDLNTSTNEQENSFRILCLSCNLQVHELQHTLRLCRIDKEIVL